MPIASLLDWFAGGSGAHSAHGGGATRYMDLIHCMGGDTFWITVTVTLDLAVAAGYLLIARHWSRNARRLDRAHPAYVPLQSLRNIFLFCGLCGYIFIPIKMVWPAWRLYDMFMLALVYFTWRYALRARGLNVIYTELGRTTQLAHDLETVKAESKRKSFFLNSVSHDLRTPLNGIVLQAAVAEMSLKQNDTEMLRETVEQMKVTARVAADLLNSFLELGRLDWEVERTTPSEFDLADLLREAVKRLAPEADRKKIELKNDLILPSLKIRTDKMKLGRILDNLVNNAVKFTDRGHVAVSAETRGADLIIAVSDTGPGISPDNIKKLFDEFYQVKNDERNYAKGFGLGLAIARKLADHLGAKITVDSELGRGSRFAVVLSGAVADAQPGRHNGQFSTNPRLLLVEDDAYSAKSLRLLLNNWGYDVTVVATIAEAKAAMSQAYDHMILDLMLPDGDGAELLRLVRQKNLPTKVTVTTGVADPDRLKDVRSLLPTEVLSKPIDLGKLMSVLR